MRIQDGSDSLCSAFSNSWRNVHAYGQLWTALWSFNQNVHQNECSTASWQSLQIQPTAQIRTSLDWEMEMLHFYLQVVDQLKFQLVTSERPSCARCIECLPWTRCRKWVRYEWGSQMRWRQFILSELERKSWAFKNVNISTINIARSGKNTVVVGFLLFLFFVVMRRKKDSQVSVVIQS